MNDNKKGIPRLLEIAGEKKGLLVLSGTFSSISAVCMLIPYVSVYFILAELLKNVSNPALVNKSLMLRWGIIALIGLILGIITMYLSGLISHTAAYRILYGLRVKLSNHIGKLPLGYFTNTSTGIIKKIMEQNVEKIENFVAHQLPDLINVLATTIIMVIAMFYLNPFLAIACIIPIILGFLVQSATRMGEKSKENLRNYHDYLEKINASTVQYVRGMPVIKVFGQTVHSFRKFYDDMISYRDYCVKYTDQFQNSYILFKVILGSLLTFILPVGVYFLSGNPQNMAFSLTLLFFLIMAPGISVPMFKFTNFASMIGDISEGVERIDNILSQTPIQEVEDSKTPKSFNITFDNVSFAYNSEEASTRKEALSDVNFTAKQGKVTALVGPSGSGKSTIANLIPRFWDVAEGSISIGNVDIRNIRSEDLMDIVSFVFQDSFLFYDTIYENILVGRPNAIKEEVYAAAKAAQCHEFIQRLPNGYDTLIGEGGTYLSGGEEQRLSVARAILKNAPILVLDEATAFADPENEYQMQLALKELMRDKTVIIIAHRLSSIQDADQIIVLKEGKIVEKGTHGELTSTDGLYKKMWDAYTDAGEWKIQKGGSIDETSL
ncbi:ABC transporter ATP-binding/permease protein [Gottschalkia purinilytica]|uniref:ABC transporter ATP-binding/permease protein n=1 Tax=Gottschalkia purinilytica TaxID=1503 RepID=A0A0L0WC11_GOTPU|nr:ABC transporter ATP-binding protein [Gottschalkia purinilytica]KNF09009.1 ABC transporter ATP-binding/permease protein [Gottschalkia purinilytica]